jgi:enoyl-CoA hydratase/carnithine racemase
MLADDDRPVSLDVGGLEALELLLDEAAVAGDCRTLALAGSDGSFCLGMDLEAMIDRGAQHAADGARLYARVVARLRTLPKLVVALVDGDAHGGGLGLVAASDLAITTPDSRFGLPELTLGLVPAMVAPLLLERVRPQQLRRLALAASAIDAATACTIGLVDEVASDGHDLERRLLSHARNAERTAPDAVAQFKGLADELTTLDWREGVARGATLTAGMLERGESLQIVRSLLEGGAPPWRQRGTTTRREAR